MTPALHPEIARWLRCRYIATVLLGPDGNLQCPLAKLIASEREEMAVPWRRAFLARDFAKRPLTHRERYGNKQYQPKRKYAA